jgi:hypothetical protein
MGALMNLGEIRVATPCQASWDEMPGDDRVRSCSLCSRSVYNIAAMTSDEAASLIASREGRLCIRLFHRADGTVVTADCPDFVTRPQFRLRRVHAFALILIALMLVRIGTKPSDSLPSGPGVTWDDWVHWSAVTLGVRPTPPPTPVLRPMVTMGDMY